MNIPHQLPVRFAQEVITANENTVNVKCTFPTFPTLPMLFEAAAQSSAGFSQEESKIGFLISVKDAELLISPKELNLILEIEKGISFGAVCEFLFTAKSPDKLSVYAKGSLTIMIQE